MPTLHEIAVQLVAPGTGILAADESEGTIVKRFAAIELPVTFETRRDYREMLFRSKEAMSKYISGVILTEETLLQSAADGTPFVQLLSEANVIPGIKVDRGAFAMPGTKGEKITEGLDGLRQRLAHYAEVGARFAKWRGVIAISSHAPTRNGIRANAHVLARYAALCQEAGIVPVVEPEVLADGEPGDHGIERCAEVTGETLEIVFKELRLAGVALDGMLLKPNMITPGMRSSEKATTEQIARRTLDVLKAQVPATVPGVAFLSGGQSDEAATANLSAMNAMGSLPWGLTYSYGRALQNAALLAWQGESANVPVAQAAFTHRARMNSLASEGQWTQELDRAA
ncbi:MAG: class I fructose-bisphosphate aldolase [Devosia sp.]